MNTAGVQLSTVSNSWMVKNSRIDELLIIQIASEYQYENIQFVTTPCGYWTI